jgi:hypothetical protein
VASSRQRKVSQSSTSTARTSAVTKPPKPFTLDHFRQYAGLMVWDDGEQRDLEDWQLEIVGDLFAGFKRNLWIVPEENGKSTLEAQMAGGEAQNVARRAKVRFSLAVPAVFVVGIEFAPEGRLRFLADPGLGEKRLDLIP